MNLSKNAALAVHVICAALQYLMPAFTNLNPQQNGAIAAFVGSIQLYLGMQAYNLTPSGAVANQSTVTTTIATDLHGATSALVQETHTEPQKVVLPAGPTATGKADGQ